MLVMLTPESPEVREFLSAWHENGRAAFTRAYSNLDYDTYYPKRAQMGTRYLALDKGNANNASGVFLVDRQTREVYSIKGYRVKNRLVGTLEELTRVYREAPRELPAPGYVAADYALLRAAKPVPRG